MKTFIKKQWFKIWGIILYWLKFVQIILACCLSSAASQFL